MRPGDRKRQVQRQNAAARRLEYRDSTNTIQVPPCGDGKPAAVGDGGHKLRLPLRCGVDLFREGKIVGDAGKDLFRLFIGGSGALPGDKLKISRKIHLLPLYRLAVDHQLDYRMRGNGGVLAVSAIYRKLKTPPSVIPAVPSVLRPECCALKSVGVTETVVW